MRAALLPAVLAALCAPGTAVAQGTEAVKGLFAGGSVSGGASTAGTSEVTLDALSDGGVNIRAVAVIRCGDGTSEAVGVGEQGRRPDGTFVAFLSRGPQRSLPGFSTRMTISGRIDPHRALGRVTVTTRFRGRVRCRGRVPFVARRPAILRAEPAAAPAGAVLLGALVSPGGDPYLAGGPFAFNLRVSRSGRRVTRAVTTYRTRCHRAPADVQETNYSPPIRIRADGTFRRTERFTVRYTDAIERAVAVTTGRFVAGGAIGTFRVRSVVRSRRGGRLVDRCDSGLKSWSAAP